MNYNAPLTIEMMRELAESRGGQCLSEVYAGNKQKLRWACSSGHEWEATPNNVKNLGSWCPHCHVNVGEELVRAALEEAFPGKAFNRTRQEPWMEGLELDGYNEELRLAFEYQGKQHFERVGHFQRSDEDFEAQLERDARTEEHCLDAFVTLLVVPFTVGFTNIRAWVRHELLDLGYEVAPTIGSASEFYDRVRAQGPSKLRQFEHARDVIHRKGGECLSTQYVGYRVPLRIRCKAGHEFEATLEAIDQPADRGPRFCPECGGTRRRTDDELREKVEACGFSYLGVESRLVGNKTRRYISVCCPAGHEFDTLWDNFSPKKGVPKKGCSVCFHAKLGASKRKCISRWCEATGINPAGDYSSAAINCKWQCSAGHTFIAKLVVLRNKVTPCTECGLTKFATDYGYRLLTPWTERSGPTTSLRWQCLNCCKEFLASLTTLARSRIGRCC